MPRMKLLYAADADHLHLTIAFARATATNSGDQTID